MEEEPRSRFRKIIGRGLLALALITMLDVTSIVEFDAFKTPRGLALTAGVGEECESDIEVYLEFTGRKQVVGGDDGLYNRGGKPYGLTVGTQFDARTHGEGCMEGQK